MIFYEIFNFSERCYHRDRYCDGKKNQIDGQEQNHIDKIFENKKPLQTLHKKTGIDEMKVKRKCWKSLGLYYQSAMTVDALKYLPAKFLECPVVREKKDISRNVCGSDGRR